MSRSGHLLTLLPLLAGLTLGLGACALAGDRPKPVSAAEPFTAVASASPVEAVAAFVQKEGETFAGSCEDTVSPRDIGKVCVRFVEERGGERAYLIGRTFSEFSTWVFVAQSSSGWNVAASTPLDFHDLSMTIPWPD